MKLNHFSTVQECLNLYANEPGCNTSCKLTYAGYGEPLCVVLDKAGVVTDCSIRTMQADEHEPFTFDQENVCTKIIMKVQASHELEFMLSICTKLN